MPKEADSGQEWWNAIFQVPTGGLSEVVKWIGVGIYNLHSIFSDSHLYAQAKSYLISNKIIDSHVEKLNNNNFTYYMNMPSESIAKIMKSKYYYGLNEKLYNSEITVSFEVAT